MSAEIKLIDRLAREHRLSEEEYALLISSQSEPLSEYAAAAADRARQAVYGRKVYLRGLIEISNVCRNNCCYCGIRRDNKNCERYTLSESEIFSCCAEGHRLGFRTFVMQGGEGVYGADRICALVKEIKNLYPGSAVTLSLGEFSREEYAAMRKAGADRYLLRHETADAKHYASLHPDMSYENRMRCLRDLKELGFQTGCGFMVGSPGQTPEILAKDLKFIEEFQPEMCGIGPFIPQKDTPFAEKSAGTCSQTVFLLSLLRLIKPNLLLPATTALGTIDPAGREKGLKAGANVVMPNLSPVSMRKKYALYDNKICTGEESAQCIKCLESRINAAGYELSFDRGDIITKI